MSAFKQYCEDEIICKEPGTKVAVPFPHLQAMPGTNRCSVNACELISTYFKG